MDNLTPQEQTIVEHYHQQAMGKIAKKRLRLKLLKVAFEFEAWMQETGAGPTYSTFCDDFGYESDKTENRKMIYENVLEIITVADRFI